MASTTCTVEIAFAVLLTWDFEAEERWAENGSGCWLYRMYTCTVPDTSGKTRLSTKRTFMYIELEYQSKMQNTEFDCGRVKDSFYCMSGNIGGQKNIHIGQ